MLITTLKLSFKKLYEEKQIDMTLFLKGDLTNKSLLTAIFHDEI